MTTILKFTYLTISILIAFNVKAEKVECPPTMKWRFEGICGKELKSIKDDKCPQGSKLTQLHVTGTMMCVSEGKCSGDMVPNAVIGVVSFKPNNLLQFWGVMLIVPIPIFLYV